MKITKVQDGTKLELALEGRLDTTTAPELEQVFNEVLGYVTEVSLDFSKLEYISSAGLRALLMARRKLADKDAMKVKGVNDIVREVFEVTGFNDIISIE